MFRGTKSKFVFEPSEQWLEAVKILKALQETEGGDSALTAYAEATHKDNKEAYLDRYGLKSTSGARCIRRLNGERCKRGYQFSRCECTPPADDHPEMFIKDGEAHVYVSQPYSLGLEQMRDIVAFCDRHNLEVWIQAGPAWHFPGGVLHVEYKKRDAALREYGAQHAVPK